MTQSICIFVGNITSINERQIINLGQMLSDEFELHLVTSAAHKLNYASPDFQVFGCSTERLFDAGKELRQYLRLKSPNVLVQLSDPPVHGTLVASLGRIYDVPTVYRYAGDRFLEYRVCRGRQKIASFALGAILGRVPIHFTSESIALGPTGCRRLVARGMSPDKITIIPPSVDTARFSGIDTTSLDYNCERSIALFVGRLSRLKGAQILEKTLPNILAERPDLEFVFVGSIERRLSIPARFRDRIEYIGPVEPEQVPKYMHLADVLVHPSLTEGLPRVVLEALAAGTPVLARDVGDISSATENTFQTNSEFETLVCNYEQLTLDPIYPFSLEALEPKYVSFFRQFL